MRVPLQRTAHLALALLVMAGAEAGTSFAWAHAASQQKSSTASKSRASAHRTKTSKKSRRREKGQKAPTPDRISEIQQALAKDGSFSGAPNGKWDDATVDAMKKFQESHGLNPTGKLDAKTLQQLGLGSQTAGAAPPLHPASSKTAAVVPAQTARKQQ
jgi:peptidoglycan hydrolase-like protein with peptidoglycan-binding domain